jgi:hypothetical protein
LLAVAVLDGLAAPEPELPPPDDSLLELALSLLAPALSLLALSLLAPPLSDEPLAGLGDEYRSLYQPLPLSMNDERDINFSSAPPHCSHSDLGGSLMRCWYSNSLPHPLHLYSYVGMKSSVGTVGR